MSTSTTNIEPNPVSVIGTGAMGSAVARALLSQGNATTVWNRTAGRADELVADGAIRAETAAEAATSSPLVILCVLDQQAVDDLRDQIGPHLAGKVLVSLASANPAQARDMASWAAQQSAEYLDGSILADPEDIGSAEAFLLYSGSPSGFEQHESALRTLGGATTWFGPDPGLGAVYFMGLVGLGYETWIAYLHTLAFVVAEQGDPAAFASLATGMFGASDELLASMSRSVTDGQHPPDAGTLDVHAALMDDLIATRESNDVDTVRLRHVKELVDRRVAQGHGAEGFSSLVELIRSRSRVD